MAFTQVETGQNVYHLGKVDLTAEAGNTVKLQQINRAAFIGTESIEIQMIFNGANANADATEVTAFNSMIQLADTATNTGLTITDGTSLAYVFATNGADGILAEEIATKTLEWLTVSIDVAGGADAGTVDVYIKTHQN